MWLGTSQQLDKITVRDVQLLSTEVTVVDSARNFGVIIDSQLSLDAHVAAVCRSGYYQLRQVRPVTRSLSADAAKTLVQVFISSRLDYCNALLYGVSDGLMCRLQSVQNAATRLVTNRRAAPRSHHADSTTAPLAARASTSDLQDRRPGLPVSDWPGTGVSVADDCRLTSDVSTRRLRSTDTAMCVVRRSNNSFGDRCFAAAGPRQSCQSIYGSATVSDSLNGC